MVVTMLVVSTMTTLGSVSETVTQSTDMVFGGELLLAR